MTSKQHFGIKYLGSGDSWFVGMSQHGRPQFDLRNNAFLFASYDEAFRVLSSSIPSCVRIHFGISDL